jgi:O-antigen/teichoic acid export membrane protein
VIGVSTMVGRSGMAVLEGTALAAPPAGSVASGRSLPMHLNSIALILGKMATLGVGFLVWLLAARLLPPAEVGLASGAVSAMMLCVQIALFGAGAAVITLFPRHQERPANLLDTAIGVVGVASLVAAVAFLGLASGLFRELRILAAIPGYAIAFIAMCALGTLGVLFDQIGTAQRRGDQVLVRGVVFGVVTLGIIIALPLGVGVTDASAILAAWVGGGLVSVGLGYAQLRRSLPTYRYRPRLHRQLAVQLIGVGLPNWALTMTERAPGLILPIVVTELLSPEANATWYAVWMMAWVVYVIPVQVGLSLFAEAAHRPDDLGLAVRRGLGLALAIGAVGAVGAAIVGPFMLSFLGPSYVESGTTPLRILVVAVLPFAFVQAYFSACRSRQKLGEAILTGVCSGLVGVGAAVLAGLTYGLSGMAVAWLLTQIVTGAWAISRLRSISGRNWGRSRGDTMGARHGPDVAAAGLPATDSAVS